MKVSYIGCSNGRRCLFGLVNSQKPSPNTCKLVPLASFLRWTHKMNPPRTTITRPRLPKTTPKFQITPHPSLSLALALSHPLHPCNHPLKSFNLLPIANDQITNLIILFGDTLSLSQLSNSAPMGLFSRHAVCSSAPLLLTALVEIYM